MEREPVSIERYERGISTLDPKNNNLRAIGQWNFEVPFDYQEHSILLHAEALLERDHQRLRNHDELPSRLHNKLPQHGRKELFDPGSTFSPILYCEYVIYIAAHA